jgi:hypothetical protein
LIYETSFAEVEVAAFMSIQIGDTERINEGLKKGKVAEVCPYSLYRQTGSVSEKEQNCHDTDGS